MRKKIFVDRIIKDARVVSIKCDFCGKEIDGEFWVLKTSHGDWGNDSIESVERFDICSAECISKALNDYIENCEDSCTQRFELEQDSFRPESNDDYQY